ncbi:PorT family protein [Chitinophaga agrisoli]|uniref:PorT family protein n=1 Tax=Chitinophaga agrisoli TaxID=2607653 RepID=A0A5B2W2P0_9BACT|nr:porin family protein [Chitinophaga agrisoli]KAA2245128.1 PorT family protein [Chitinophaga agrisoli]
MKKYALLVLLALGTLSTYAQVSFGLKAGYSNSNIKFEDNEGISRLSAWHAGVIADLSLSEDFSLQPQLLVSAKGAQQGGVSVGGLNVGGTKMSLTYLELPVNFMYKIKAGSGKFFIGVGPYIAYGIGGKIGDQKIKFDGKSFEEVGEGDENAHLKALDFGGNILAGYELKNGLLFSINYSMGLTDISADDEKSKNNYFGVSVGYLLHTKKK